jgi:hypothetical protein
MTAVDAAEVFGRHFGHVTTEDMIECTERDRNRIFNLGYYTWVEQQGTGRVCAATCRFGMK